MDIRFHFIKGLVADGKITLKHCGTDEQLPNVFTKPLPVHERNYFRSMLNVCSFDSRGVLKSDQSFSSCSSPSGKTVVALVSGVSCFQL